MRFIASVLAPHSYIDSTSILQQYRPPSEAGRSVSPASDPGAIFDESPKGKGKGKSVNKRAGEKLRSSDNQFLASMLEKYDR